MGNADSYQKNEKLDFLQTYPMQKQQQQQQSQKPQHPSETHQRKTPQKVTPPPQTHQLHQQLQPQQPQQQTFKQLVKGSNDWRMSLVHPHILKTLSRQLEGENYRYYFEYCQITLATLLTERIGTKKYFPEEDLQALAQGILSALSYLQEKGIPHGDLTSSEIYFDQSSSSFKILDADLINGRASSIVSYIMSGRFSALSPEFLQTLLTQPHPQIILSQIPVIPEQYYFKNDIWTLGMTLLEASSLRLGQEIYQNNQIRYDLIQQRLNEIAQIYSINYCNIIASMLTLNSEERPDALTLFNQLRLQSQEIVPEPPSQYLRQEYNQDIGQKYHFKQDPMVMGDNTQKSLIQYQQDITQKNLSYTMPQQQPPPFQQQQQNTYPYAQKQVPSCSPTKQQTPTPPYVPVPMPQSYQQQQQQLSSYYQQQITPNPPPTIPPNQQGQIPVRQVIKKLVYPDGHVEYQVQQVDSEKSQSTLSPSRMNIIPPQQIAGQQMAAQQITPQQISPPSIPLAYANTLNYYPQKEQNQVKEQPSNYQQMFQFNEQQQYQQPELDYEQVQQQNYSDYFQQNILANIENQIRTQQFVEQQQYQQKPTQNVLILFLISVRIFIIMRIEVHNFLQS